MARRRLQTSVPTCTLWWARFSDMLEGTVLLQTYQRVLLASQQYENDAQPQRGIEPEASRTNASGEASHQGRNTTRNDDNVQDADTDA